MVRDEDGVVRRRCVPLFVCLDVADGGGGDEESAELRSDEYASSISIFVLTSPFVLLPPSAAEEGLRNLPLSPPESSLSPAVRLLPSFRGLGRTMVSASESLLSLFGSRTMIGDGWRSVTDGRLGSEGGGD